MSLVSPVKAIPRRLQEAVTPHNTPTEGSLVECEDCGMTAPLDLPHECSPRRASPPCNASPPPDDAIFISIVRPEVTITLPLTALKRQLKYTVTETNDDKQTWSVSRPLPPSNDPKYADLFERCHSWVEHLNPGMVYTLTGPAEQPPSIATLQRFAEGNCTACGTHLEYAQGDKYICLECPHSHQRQECDYFRVLRHEPYDTYLNPA